MIQKLNDYHLFLSKIRFEKYQKKKIDKSYLQYFKTDLSLSSPTVAKCKMCVSFHIFVGRERALRKLRMHSTGDIEIFTVKFNLIHFSLLSSLPPVGRKYLWGYKIFSFPKNNSDHQSKH